jgi:translation elongation factor P/translation initiation factor 5A
MRGDLYHNIHRSAFRPGLHIGYANGLWRIIKVGTRWHATKGSTTIRGTSLKDISDQLHKIATKEKVT